MTSTAGHDPAKVVQGRIVNVNLVNWTVDVVSTFDRHRYFDVQVGSLYAHYSRGEGAYAFPEVGAVVMVVLPSDSSPPYVQTFLMPMESVDTVSEEAPAGTRSHGAPAASPRDASFAGGRGRGKPGDIVLRGRDGNFVVLHRGGVLQVGASELAQRIYMPLSNLITDIAENYAMHSAGGSVTWGLQDGPSLTKYPTQYQHTFRVFANDKFADVRVSVGKVYTPLPEPEVTTLPYANVAQTEDSPIICEIAVAPGGFAAENGDPSSSAVPKQSVFKFVFDRNGNTLLRCAQLSFLTKKYKVRSATSIEFEGETFSVKATGGMDLDGGSYAHLKGGIVRLGAGQSPVARVQDLVSVPVAAVPVVIVFANPPVPGANAGVLTIGAPGAPLPLSGSIVTGNDKVLA